MYRTLICSFIFCLLASLLPCSALAVYNPTIVPNNIFGIHIADPNDIGKAAKLVNDAHVGSVADWGYVTLVITDTDRNRDKWSEFFRKLRNYHLIPIVRLATHAQGAVWAKPQQEDVRAWVAFLNSLPWPIQNRYIILWNEPNTSKEWGGEVNPAEYAQLTDSFYKTVKSANSNFFLLPAGFDLYAGNNSQSMDAARYWDEMDKAHPGIFSLFDGWSSHSYPRSNFTGSPNDTGRYSIVGYKWEIDYLQVHFGINPTLPVFITETGWAQHGRLDRQTIASYYQSAFNDSWKNDPTLVAVTPFLLNYQDGLFQKFSFQKLGSDEFYPQFTVVADLAKVAGKPLKVPFSALGKVLLSQQIKQFALRIPDTSNVLSAFSTE